MSIDDLTQKLNGKVQEQVQEINKKNGSEGLNINSLLGTEKVKTRINQLLGEKTEYFISTILSVVRDNKDLQQCDPNSILGSAIISATLDLPIEPNLGFAYLIPFNTRVNGEYKKVCKFLIGYKGYTQLAIRSGVYKTISSSEVYEGEVRAFNRFTGDIEFGTQISNKVIGYMAYYRLLNGFEKYIYMSKEQVEEHAKKYSKTYNSSNSVWKTDFNAMASKTVLKKLLSKFGILSIQMQGALTKDNTLRMENEEGEMKVLQEDVIMTLDDGSYITNDGEIIPNRVEIINEEVKKVNVRKPRTPKEEKA